MQSTAVDRAGERRAWFLVYETGDRVVETLTRFARQHDVAGAHVRAVGALSSATLAYFDWEVRDYTDIPVDEQVEVASLLGDVTRTENGEPKVHLHCVLGRRGGAALAGHLKEATVRPTLELFLIEEGMPLVRRHDDESGLDLIRIEP